MSQIAGDVFLVRPCHFGSNDQTASTNSFQMTMPEAPANCWRQALVEFDGLVDCLAAAGVRTLVGNDTQWPVKPDAVFPNNWVSFHGDGSVVVYPMAAPNRRPERRLDLIRQVQEQGGFSASRLVDLSSLETGAVFLEGTGSLVFDHRNGLAFAALSSRTHPEAISHLKRELRVDVIEFDTCDHRGRPLYHTNVMMSLGEQYAIVCADVITDPLERRRVMDKLISSGREIIEIDYRQMQSFSANVLQMTTARREPVIAMSAAAHAALSTAQLTALSAHGRLLAVPLPLIEAVGGGSVRCMLADILLPRAVPE
ncbi:MAG: arginine deiminase-related protein [Gammaproteobacteria bacterium]|nr:arginine deiminase-related protein [Gammaproteobacteria bacterium]